MSTKDAIISEIEIPTGVTIEIKGTEIETKGSLGSNKRHFNDALLKVHKNSNKIIIEPVTDKNLAKKAMKVQNSFKKELENDISGVTKHFEIKMRTVYAHFPISLEIKNGMVYINNIIGERFPRTANIIGETKIEVKGQNVRLYGPSLDNVTQTAANIRQTCKIRNKDSRVFQDGLYYEIE
jgi:large subunit ribosomal protein L6